MGNNRGIFAFFTLRISWGYLRKPEKIREIWRKLEGFGEKKGYGKNMLN